MVKQNIYICKVCKNSSDQINREMLDCCYIDDNLIELTDIIYKSLIKLQNIIRKLKKN